MNLPEPAYIDPDGTRFHTVAAGVRIIGRELISFQTLTYYALDIHPPPDGPNLRVIQRPLARTARNDRQPKHHLLLEEESLLQLRLFLQERGGAGWRKARAARQIARPVSALGF